jgi:hypothetical protein
VFLNVTIFFQENVKKSREGCDFLHNGRPDDGQQTLTKHQAVIREEYAKIAARPKGQYHAIVSHPPVTNELIF